MRNKKRHGCGVLSTHLVGAIQTVFSTPSLSLLKSRCCVWFQVKNLILKIFFFLMGKGVDEGEKFSDLNREEVQ
jgi:hypothetical protein